jgi:hypothetical protein
MRIISLTLFLGVALVSPAAAGQAQISPPFAKLFRAPTGPLVESPPAAARGQRSMLKPVSPARQSAKIVCGMTLIAVDSSLDPKIERPVPTGTKFTLKTSKPPVCGQ